MTWGQHRVWILAVLIISGLIIAWLIAQDALEPVPATESLEVSTTTDLTGRAIYANGEYGFSISYPETARLDETVLPGHHLPNAWRVNALPEATGTQIATIVAYSTESDHSYPRHFVAAVRIGASADAEEIARCLKPQADAGEEALPDATINGDAWKAFSFGDAAMMQYVKGVSYRTIHEGKCFALEKVQSGSSYREDPVGPDTISDEVLAARYASLEGIVETFDFARP